VTRFRNWKKRG